MSNEQENNMSDIMEPSASEEVGYDSQDMGPKKAISLGWLMVWILLLSIFFVVALSYGLSDEKEIDTTDQVQDNSSSGYIPNAVTVKKIREEFIVRPEDLPVSDEAEIISYLYKEGTTLDGGLDTLSSFRYITHDKIEQEMARYEQWSQSRGYESTRVSESGLDIFDRDVSVLSMRIQTFGSNIHQVRVWLLLDE